MDDPAEVKDLISTSLEAKKPGFFYGHIVVLASFLIMMMIFGLLFTFGIFFKPVLNEFGWSRALTSGAYSVCFILQGVFGIVAGGLSDRFGPRIVVAVSALIGSLGFMLMSQVTAVWQIYLFYGVMVSIGVGPCFVSLMSIVAKWFDRRRGLMTGIVAAGMGAGMLVMPLWANQLISTYSWRASYTRVGLVALVVCVISALFLKREPGHAGKPAGAAVEVKNNTSPEVPGLNPQEAVRTRQFWAFGAMVLLWAFCAQIVFVHIVPHATDLGISATTAATIMSVIGAITIVATVSIGSTGDRIGHKRAAVIALVLMFLGFLWLLFARELWMLYLFAVVVALSYGGLISMISPLVADHFGLKAHGIILGLLMMGLTIGGAVGPLVAGNIFDTTGSYFRAFIIGTILAAMGLLAVILLRPRREGMLKA